MPFPCPERVAEALSGQGRRPYYPQLDDLDREALRAMTEPNNYVHLDDVSETVALEIKPQNPMEIFDGDGVLLFAVKQDGSVRLPDPKRAKEAAAIFWREVLSIAVELGIYFSFLDDEAESE